VAGCFSFWFGGRYTVWKKGWDETRSEAHANTVLMADAMRHAQQQGCRWFDFVAMDRDLAEAVRRGDELPEGLTRRRDFFNLGFGGEPWLLPAPMIRLAGPVTGLGYGALTAGLWVSAARRLVQRVVSL